MGYIYCITNIVNGKMYVGQTYDYEYRWARHKKDYKYSYNDSIILYRAFRKYGLENFDFKVVEECDDSIMSDKEMYWIAKLNTFVKDTHSNGYNMTRGGEKLLGDSNPFFGKKHTKEIRAKLSSVASERVGELNGFYGKTHTQKTKDKLAQGRIGKSMSSETKLKLSIYNSEHNAFKGKHHSNATRAVISTKAKGRRAHNRKQIDVYDKDMKFITHLDGIPQAHEFLLNNGVKINSANTTKSSVLRAISAKRLYKNYYWFEGVTTIETTSQDEKGVE